MGAIRKPAMFVTQSQNSLTYINFESFIEIVHSINLAFLA